MPIEVLTPASRHDLASLAQVQLELGLDDADLQESGYLLSNLIRQASSFIYSYTDRVFAQETVSERLGANGGRRLYLSRYPIVEVVSVSYRGAEIDADSYYIEDAESGFLYREVGWKNTTIMTGAITMWPTRFRAQDWNVVYTAGYKLPDQPNRTLPYDLERACVDIVKAWYTRSRSDADVVASEKIGEASVTYREMETYIPSHIMNSLDRYKAV